MTQLDDGMARRLQVLPEPHAGPGCPAPLDDGPDPFIGGSAAMRELARAAARVAASDSPLLIQGETGTGKGVLARWLHRHSRRAAGPLVDLNCAGLSRELLEAELCGHARGAFTGAVADKPGLFEAAHGGSVFLDEIGDMDAAIQPRLLKLLEDRRVRRLGEVRDRAIDVRLIAATHRDLLHRAAAGAFRDDLYFRISTLPLRIPPLRERSEDIPALARSLLERIARAVGRGPLTLSGDALARLCRHPWPGNIRELRNVIERAAWLSDASTLPAAALVFDALPGHRDGEAAPQTLEELERRHIRETLAAAGGQVQAAAARLGIARSSLYEKLRRFGIEAGRGSS